MLYISCIRIRDAKREKERESVQSSLYRKGKVWEDTILAKRGVACAYCFAPDSESVFARNIDRAVPPGAWMSTADLPTSRHERGGAATGDIIPARTVHRE